MPDYKVPYSEYVRQLGPGAGIDSAILSQQDWDRMPQADQFATLGEQRVRLDDSDPMAQQYRQQFGQPTWSPQQSGRPEDNSLYLSQSRSPGSTPLPNGATLDPSRYAAMGNGLSINEGSNVNGEWLRGQQMNDDNSGFFGGNMGPLRGVLTVLGAGGLNNFLTTGSMFSAPGEALAGAGGAPGSNLVDGFVGAGEGDSAAVAAGLESNPIALGGASELESVGAAGSNGMLGGAAPGAAASTGIFGSLGTGLEGAAAWAIKNPILALGLANAATGLFGGGGNKPGGGGGPGGSGGTGSPTSWAPASRGVFTPNAFTQQQLDEWSPVIPRGYGGR